MARCREYLFDHAVKELKPRKAEVIVDLGCIKSAAVIAVKSYGYSTVKWMQLCPEAQIYTVDIDPQSVRMSKHVMGHRFREEELHRVHWILQDAAKFMRKFDQYIDIMYFDGPGEEGSRDCLYLASPMLQIGSVILFDDCDLPDGQDGRRPVIADAEKLGFRTVIDNGRQVLMSRRHIV